MRTISGMVRSSNRNLADYGTTYKFNNLYGYINIDKSGFEELVSENLGKKITLSSIDIEDVANELELHGSFALDDSDSEIQSDLVFIQDGKRLDSFDVYQKIVEQIELYKH